MHAQAHTYTCMHAPDIRRDPRVHQQLRDDGPALHVLPQAVRGQQSKDRYERMFEVKESVSNLCRRLCVLCTSKNASNVMCGCCVAPHTLPSLLHKQTEPSKARTST